MSHTTHQLMRLNAAPQCMAVAIHCSQGNPCGNSHISKQNIAGFLYCALLLCNNVREIGRPSKLAFEGPSCTLLFRPIPQACALLVLPSGQNNMQHGQQ